MAEIQNTDNNGEEIGQQDWHSLWWEGKMIPFGRQLGSFVQKLNTFLTKESNNCALEYLSKELKT